MSGNDPLQTSGYGFRLPDTGQSCRAETAPLQAVKLDFQMTAPMDIGQQSLVKKLISLVIVDGDLSLYSRFCALGATINCKTSIIVFNIR